MAQEKGRPLPKFGEWDVNNPASAEGFTVIFSKARDEKKTNGTAAAGAPAGTSNQGARNNRPNNNRQNDMSQYPSSSKKWFCCF